MLTFITTGITLALSAVAIPGGLQANLLNVTLRYGRKLGLIAIFSPLISDIPIMIVMVFILGNLPETVLDIIRVAGGLFLFSIAWGAYQQIRSGETFKAKEGDTGGSARQVLLTAVAINFLTPGPYIFWATLTGPMLLEALRLSIWHAAAFLASFYTVFIGGLALLVIFFDRVGSISPRVTRNILIVTIVLLLYFGGLLIADGVGLR